MQMRVRERNNEVQIELTRLGGRQQTVLEVLGREDAAAAVDRSKLESMSVRARADAMDVRLRAKTGQRLDPTAIYRSLRDALCVSVQIDLTATAADRAPV